MHVKLEDIVSITTGIYEKGSPSGDAFYLQAKHFDENGQFRKEAILTPEIHMDDRLGKHILQDKDLLIMAKGESNRVCFYYSGIGQSVASSTFFVIRLKVRNVIPEYLQWYLNSSKMQALFANLSKGTRIRSLSKKSLLGVDIEIPPLEQQKKVLQLQKLWNMERKTTLALLEQKELLYQNLLLNLGTSKQLKNE